VKNKAAGEGHAVSGRGIRPARDYQATRRIVESSRMRADAFPVVRVSGRRLNAERRGRRPERGDGGTDEGAEKRALDFLL
jgi:hypothetical protein